MITGDAGNGAAAGAAMGGTAGGIRRRQDRRQERQQQADPPSGDVQPSGRVLSGRVNVSAKNSAIWPIEGLRTTVGIGYRSILFIRCRRAANPGYGSSPFPQKHDSTPTASQHADGPVLFFRGGNIGCRLRDYLIDLSGRGQRRAVDSVHKGSGFDVHDIFRFRLGCGKKFLEPSDMEITLYNGLLTLWLLSSQLFWTLSESC